MLEDDGEEKDDAGHDVDRPGLVARRVEAVRDRRDHECTDDRAAHLAPAAEEARAADDRRGDRVEEQRAAADVEVDGVQPRGQDDAAHAGHGARDHENDDPDAGDVDAGATSRFGIAADCVDVATERGPLCQEVQADEEDDDEDAGQR